MNSILSNIKLSKNKLNSFLQTLFIFLIVLETRSVFSRLDNGSINQLAILGIILCLLLIICLNFNLNIKKSHLGFLFLYYIIMILFLFINPGDNKLGFSINFLIVLPLFFIVLNIYTKMEISRLLEIYVHIIFTIACISLLFYIMGSVANIIHPNVAININWTTDPSGIKNIAGYFFVHFNTQETTMFGLNILRNTSIFVEGPMYALHLMFATTLSINIKKNIINKYSLIFGLTILTTLSVTGILFYLFILLYKYILFCKTNSKLILLPFVIIGILMVGTLFYTDKQSTSSYNIRTDDYAASFQVFEQYPIFGGGYQNRDIIVKYMSDFRQYNTGLSNSFITIIAQGGIFLTIFYLAPIILDFLKIFRDRKSNFTIFQLILLQMYLFFTITYQYSSLMMFFLALDYYLLLSNNNNANLILERNTKE